MEIEDNRHRDPQEVDEEDSTFEESENAEQTELHEDEDCDMTSSATSESEERSCETNEGNASSSLTKKTAGQQDGCMIDIDLNQPSDSERSETSASVYSSDGDKDSTSTDLSPVRVPGSSELKQCDNHSALGHVPRTAGSDPPSVDSENDTVLSISQSQNSPSRDQSIQPHIQVVSSFEQDSILQSPCVHSNIVIKSCENVSQTVSANQVEDSSHHKEFPDNVVLLTKCDSHQNEQSRPASDRSRDENDTLLSELDAELEISESPIENDIEDLPNGMRRRKISLSDIPEYKELKTKYESLQKHLEQQIMDSQKLKTENEKISITLEVAVKERDVYLEKLQEIQKKSGNDPYLIQIKELEFTLAKQNKEMNQMREKMASHDTAAKRAVTTLQSELKVRVEQVTKQLEDCKKDKESMVMKYAAAEAKNIEMQEKMYKNDRRVAECTKDKDVAMNKFKQMKEEKKKMQEIYENRAMEISSLRREIERLKDIINTTEIKGKWAHNKLKAELEAHKETKGKVEDLEKKLRQSRDDCDHLKKECEATVRSLQEAEEAKARNLDGKLKETQCELMLHKQEKSDQDEVAGILRNELESLKNKHKELLEELKVYKDKVLCLDEERIHQEETLTRYKHTLQTQKLENTEMREKLEKLENIETEVTAMREQVKKANKKVEDTEQANRDYVADMEACARRESEYLELQQKLSDKNVVLQSENARQSINLSKLSHENESLSTKATGLESKLQQVEQELNMVKRARHEETTNLSTQLEKKTKEAEDLARKVDEEKDEIKTLKRKHAANTKDLLRQLQQAKRRLESVDRGEKDVTSVGSMGSRTSSNGSLDTLANNSSSRGTSQENAPSPVQEEIHPIVEVVEIDKNMLMEKIVKLQKINARKSEKIEFVEDHNRQLLEEVRKKSRIIQHYALREEAGILSSEKSDINKAQISKKGGIMASLYTQHVQDGNLTLEMSLQITQKLQQVLEDTLIKNITLKDNLDTLGQEIARLSQENRKLQLHIQELQERR